MAVSTHSRAEAAAFFISFRQLVLTVSTHSRAEAAAQVIGMGEYVKKVSTHSRAEAAACIKQQINNIYLCFNTQPRGGGCLRNFISCSICKGFNTQPRGGGCTQWLFSVLAPKRFNTQPRGGGCSLPKKARKISVLNTVFR